MEGLIGLAVLLLFGLLLALFAWRRVGARVGLRPLPAFAALVQQISRAVESGGNLHTSLGTGGVGGTETLTSLAGIAVLDRLADQAAAAGVSPTVTIADATLLPVAQDSLRRAFIRRDRGEQYQPEQVLLLSPHPTAYAAAAMSVAQDDATAGNVLIGSWGSEIALLNEASARSGVPQVAGAAEPQAQALLFPAADHALLGEEIFATRAYLGGPDAAGQLLAQDIVRALVVLAIAALAVLNLVSLTAPGG
jgi:hypothetical protein